jgi:Ca-activated chloride channel family protein
MQPDNRLPLLKRGLRMLVGELDARDHVSMVVYAGSSGTVLPPTSGDQHATILAALDRLEAGGSTNGAEGIRLAYELASKHFIKGGSNRVILATDGDFNVGTTSEGELVRLIEREAKSGVYLSVLGFGKGNLKDSTMEKLADRGNGNYAYVDTLQEARKVLVEQMTGTLITVAKDVKLQIEFNPNAVAAYRQIGYEDRQLRDEDFRNDKIDAGDIGAGHTVTALFDVVPVGVPTKLPIVDPLKYRAPAPLVAGVDPNELATVKIRYKPPAGAVSTVSSFTVKNDARSWSQASPDFRFAAAVAEMGMLLRGSKYRAGATWASELALARSALGDDREGYRAEMIRLSEQAEKLAASTAHASR